eukprot:GHVO01005432.1.p1 GENE.GHVO01005432.1~~GHVO01005432.1.p1  ORF type:complete len:368 (+),score=54.48 GHVO01005432.1:345-1448(+)
MRRLESVPEETQAFGSDVDRREETENIPPPPPPPVPQPPTRVMRSHSPNEISSHRRIDTDELSQDLNDYIDLGEIGRGQFGSVHKVMLKTRKDRLLVWKKVDYRKMTDREKMQLAQEVRLLQSLDHEGVVKFAGKINEKTSRHLYLIMEYCDGGDLNSYLEYTVRRGQPLPEELIVSFFAQLTRALHYCHTRPEGRVLHRDLKPQNVFLLCNYSKAKLGDFGLAKRLQPKQAMTATTVGTPYYMSPEVLKRNSYDEKSDVWALGCLVYEMATGVPPHSKADSFEALQKLVFSGQTGEFSCRYSDELHLIIRKMLAIKPGERPTTSEIMQTAIFKWGDAISRISDLSAQIMKLSEANRQQQQQGGRGR